MKTAIRILVIIAVLYAIAPPASYALLFALGLHRSALVDLVVVLSCVLLGVSEFRKLPLFWWLTPMVVLALSASIGFVHHFRDSGESAPLPFEWLNRYYVSALPLLAVSVVSRAMDTHCRAKKEAQQNQ